MYKERPSWKCRYNGTFESRKHSRKIQIYQKKSKEHVKRIEDEELPKLAIKYQPVGKRCRGRPKRDGKISSWKRVEEYWISKSSKQLKKKKFNDVRVASSGTMSIRSFLTIRSLVF
jgi:hypothetical protein